MKSHLIQLEPHDDLASIRDKMSWAKAPRILLVWKPRRRPLRLSEIDLTLLRRHAASLGADVGLVTSQRGLRRVAEHAGIPVYRTAAEAQRAALLLSAPKPGPSLLQADPRGLRDIRSRRKRLELSREAASRVRRPSWTTRLPARVTFFILGLLSLALLAFVFVPSAQVQLQPATRMQELRLPVSASPEVESVGLSGLVPARSLTVTVSGSDSRAATGSLLLPASSASGSVTVTNLLEDSVVLPAGTVLISGTDAPARYITTTAVEVPGGPGQTAEVGVRALQGGPAGNLPAQTTFSFSGPLGLSLSAANAGPLTGGAETHRRTPTEDDRSQLYARLAASLTEEALLQAQALEPSVFAETLVATKTLQENYSPGAGQPGGELRLNLEQEFEVKYAAEEDLRALGLAALDASMPAGYEPVPGGLTLTAVSEPTTDGDGVTHWEILASRELRAAVFAHEVIASVRGLPLARAQADLAAMLPSSKPKIRVHPSWFPILPLIPMRILVDTGS